MLSLSKLTTDSSVTHTAVSKNHLTEMEQFFVVRWEKLLFYMHIFKLYN